MRARRQTRRKPVNEAYLYQKLLSLQLLTGLYPSLFVSQRPGKLNYFVETHTGLKFTLTVAVAISVIQNTIK